MPLTFRMMAEADQPVFSIPVAIPEMVRSSGFSTVSRSGESSGRVCGPSGRIVDRLLLRATRQGANREQNGG